MTTDLRRNPDSKRISKLFVAHMSSERLPRHEVVIRNISHDGVGVRSKHEAPHVGEKVLLEMAHQDTREGVVRWVEGQKMGIQLSTSLDPDSYHFEDKDWHEVHVLQDQKKSARLR